MDASTHDDLPMNALPVTGSELNQTDPDSWESNAQHMLERCPYTVWQRPGNGPVDLKATLIVTFSGMQMRLDGHPMFKDSATKCAESAEALKGREARMRASGMAGLLSEILGNGALDRRGDDDLIDRVKQAVSDQEAASGI